MGAAALTVSRACNRVFIVSSGNSTKSTVVPDRPPATSVSQLSDGINFGTWDGKPCFAVRLQAQSSESRACVCKNNCAILGQRVARGSPHVARLSGSSVLLAAQPQS